MKMPINRLLLPAAFALALASGPAAATDTPEAAGTVTFSASVRVDVDATGAPVAVEAPQHFEDGVRAIIEERVASWQYHSAQVDGKPVPATTYVSVNVCAVPKPGGYWLGVDFVDNGARVADGKELVPPAYPARAYRNGTEAELEVILDITPEGRAELEEFDKFELIGAGSKSDFEREIRNWVKTLRFDMERVAGAPVSARVLVPIMFAMRGSETAKAIVREQRAAATTSRECRVASGESAGLRPVALEPAVTVIPAPAS